MSSALRPTQRAALCVVFGRPISSLCSYGMYSTMMRYKSLLASQAILKWSLQQKFRVVNIHRGEGETWKLHLTQITCVHMSLLRHHFPKNNCSFWSQSGFICDRCYFDTDSWYVRLVFWTGDFMFLKAAPLPFIARSNANGSLTAGWLAFSRLYSFILWLTTILIHSVNIFSWAYVAWTANLKLELTVRFVAVMSGQQCWHNRC